MQDGTEQKSHFYCYIYVFFIVLDIRLIKRDCTPLVKAKVRQRQKSLFF